MSADPVTVVWEVAEGFEGAFLKLRKDGVVDRSKWLNGGELVALATRALALAALSGVHPNYITSVITERLGRLNGLDDRITAAIVEALGLEAAADEHELDITEGTNDAGTPFYRPRCSCNGWHPAAYTRRANAVKAHERHVAKVAG